MFQGIKFLSSQATKASKFPSFGKQLFVANLTYVTGEHQLKEYFSRFGKVTSVSLFYDLTSGLHKGFSFVLFEKEESVTKAIAVEPHIIDNAKLEVRVSLPYEMVQSTQKKSDCGK